MGGSLAASRFAQHTSKKSFQEMVDIWDLYCMTYYYRNCGGQNVKMQTPDPPSLEQQFQDVHESVSEQVEDLFRKLHNTLLGNPAKFPFSLQIRNSSINHSESGKGVFIVGSSAVPGTVVAFHPGLVYLPHHIRKMPNYPGMDQRSTYLISRYDGCIIDPNNYSTCIKSHNNDSISHPIAVGHMLNHPPAGVRPNVLPFSFDFHATFPQELLYLVPNRYYKEPGFLFKTQAIMRCLVYITINHVCNEELFVNYRLNPKSKLPEWYTAVDKQADSRRWNS